MIVMRSDQVNASKHLEHLVHNKCVINVSYFYYYYNQSQGNCLYKNSVIEAYSFNLISVFLFEISTFNLQNIINCLLFLIQEMTYLLHHTSLNVPGRVDLPSFGLSKNLTCTLSWHLLSCILIVCSHNYLPKENVYFLRTRVIYCSHFSFQDWEEGLANSGCL